MAPIVQLLLLTVGVLNISLISATTSCPKGNQILRRNKLSCGNKQYIIDFHNKIRNHVASGRIDGQPKAANMIEMSWNESLAELAQKRADSCDFNHGDWELNGERIGQNLAIVTSSLDTVRLNLTYMIDLWYNEVFQFGYSGEFDAKTGHYSQLIWGSTREVGCGYTYYKEDSWFKMYFVCDYYPPGNYLGQKPYVYGKFDCNSYGLSDSWKYSKLCANENSKVSVCKSEKKQTADNSTLEMNDLDAANSTEVDEIEATEWPEIEIMASIPTDNYEDTTDTNEKVTESDELPRETTEQTTTEKLKNETVVPGGSNETMSDNEVNQIGTQANETTEHKGTAKFYYETIIFSKGFGQSKEGGTFRFKYEPLNGGASPSEVQIDGVKVSNETVSLAAKLLQILTSFRF